MQTRLLISYVITYGSIVFGTVAQVTYLAVDKLMLVNHSATTTSTEYGYLSLDGISNFVGNCTELLCTNQTINGTTMSNSSAVDLLDEQNLIDCILVSILSVVLGLMILVTVIGNVFVIAAILLERNLQNVANYLVVSLAVADLMVACLVMPLGAVYVISNNWIMGPELCDMWTSIDVLCCTASILHLVAIALDRYWAITNVDYIHTRTSRRIGIMIAIIWIIALVVSLAPQIPQFKDPEYLYRIDVKKQCLVSQDVKYQIFATSSTFYVPLFVIFILYWKIFQAARRRIRRRQKLKHYQQPLPQNDQSQQSLWSCFKHITPHRKCSFSNVITTDSVADNNPTTTVNLDVDQQKDAPEEEQKFTVVTSVNHHQKCAEDSVQMEANTDDSYQIGAAASITARIALPGAVEAAEALAADEIKRNRNQPLSTTDYGRHQERKETLESKRERKAAKTLAIITGAFVMCWLPFFALALLMPLCASCVIHGYIVSFTLWLGYFNSTLNPVIYTIFNPEFRRAFKRILYNIRNWGDGDGGERNSNRRQRIIGGVKNHKK